MNSKLLFKSHAMQNRKAHFNVKFNTSKKIIYIDLIIQQTAELNPLNLLNIEHILSLRSYARAVKRM